MRTPSFPPAFKARLQARALMHGMFVGMPSPSIVEMVGYAGFDYMIVDMEHGPHGLETLENMLRAAEASGVASIVRLPSAGESDILRVLDAGAQAILVPGVNSAAQAQAVVDASYYAPHGRRGVSTVSRAARYALSVPAEHLRDAAQAVGVMLMVEGLGAIRELEAILAIEGIDGIFVGPNDLAAALGHVGNRDHPEVQAAIADVMARSKRFGRSVATLARAPEDAQTLPPRGFTMVTFNTTFILAKGLRDLRSAIMGTTAA